MSITEDPISPIPYTPGGGNGSPVPEAARIPRPDLKKEYVAAAANFHAASMPLALPRSVDDTARMKGSSYYEWMLTDPVVSASVRVLKLAILSGGMDLKATISAKPGANGITPDEQMARDMVDFCWRSVERCRGWNAFVMDLLGAAAFGNKLAEKVFEVARGGRDAGRLVWARIKVKPRDAWQFVVDDARNVIGILFRQADGRKAYLSREKFVILTWEPVDADPRGTSILRPAAEPFNFKNLVWPQLYKHLCQFGSASLIGKTAPNSPERQPFDEYGLPIVGSTNMTPQKFLANALQEFQNGSVLVVSAHDEIEAILPQGDGSAFHRAIDLLNREIVRAILLQTRATSEAEYGSKADSETAQDMFGLLVESGRTMLASTLREDCFRQLIALNYGQDVADEFTPLVTFGTDQQDRAAQWNAVANLMRSGYFGPSQLEEIDSMMGLPIRDAEADGVAKAASIPDVEEEGGDI